MPCIASRRAPQTVRPVRSSQYQVPSWAASSASWRCSCSRRSSTTLRSSPPGPPDVSTTRTPHCHGRDWPPPTMPVRCTGAVTEAVRRRPFRGLLRSLRRSRDLVLAPDLPEGDVARVVKAIDDVLDQRETNAQRAAAERVVGAYSRLDPAGRRRFLEALATRFGADAVTLDRAVDSIRV